MPQLKTRQLLVDVARQLFAKNGFDSTTMNDIAESSGKGRRTLYTYFKNKEEVYSAVIDAELMRISSMFLAVARRQLPPLEKLVELLFAHLSLMKEAVERNGNLRSAFFRNIWKVESVRKKYDKKEHDIFAKTLDETVGFLALVFPGYAVDTKRHLEEAEPAGICLLTDVKAVVPRFLLLALARQAYLRQHDLFVF